MLHETLKTLRKQKGYSQEEAAGRLNVVRQTVSKWEKGLSVPDAAMLVNIAELYEVSVAELLGASPDTDDAPSQTPPVNREIAEQLSRINEQLVIRNRRSRRIWQAAAGILIAFVLINLLVILSAMTMSVRFTESSTVTVTETDSLPTNEITESLSDDDLR